MNDRNFFWHDPANTWIWLNAQQIRQDIGVDQPTVESGQFLSAVVASSNRLS